MRREGYELQVSRPEVITHDVDGKVMEPLERLVIDTREQYIGAISETLALRKARMVDMVNDGSGNVRLEYDIPTRGLIGFRNAFLTLTQGNGAMSSLLLGYEPWLGPIGTSRNGALIASEGGIAVTYGLNNAQARGQTFIEPGTPVYEGMIVGLNQRPADLVVNVCKDKKMTNVRSSTSDIAVRLTPAVKLSLEQSLDFINSDELVEVTPQTVRLRKRLLTQRERSRGGEVRETSPPSPVPRGEGNQADHASNLASKNRVYCREVSGCEAPFGGAGVGDHLLWARCTGDDGADAGPRRQPRQRQFGDGVITLMRPSIQSLHRL